MRHLIAVLILSTCAVLQSTRAVSVIGSYCHCTAAVQSYGCTPLRLEVAPPDRTPFGSVLSVPGGPTVVATGEALPRLVIQAVSNATGVVVRSVDGSNFTATIAITGGATALADAASQTTGSFRDGFVVIDGVVVRGSDAELAAVRVTTSFGLTLTTDTVTLYNRVARPSAANTLVSLAFVTDGSSYFETSALTAVAPIVLGTTLPAVVIRVTDPAGGPVSFLDGQPATVRAEYATVVDANITLRGGSELIRGSDATFTALSLDNDTVVGTPLRFVFEVGGNSLTAGPIEATSTATNNYRLVFAASRFSAISPGSTEMHAAVGKPMAPVAIQLQDSALQADSSSSRGFVAVSCDTLGLYDEGSRARISGGRAVFDNLRVRWRRGSDRRGHIFNFTSTAVVDQTPLLSPPVYVWDGADATVGRRLRFREVDSFLPHAGAVRVAVSGTPMPRIAVEVVDAANERAFSSSGLAVSASADVGQALSGTSSIASDEGLAIFNELTLLFIEGSATVTLSFTATGIGTLQSGQITISRARLGASSLEFEEGPSALVRFQQAAGFATMGVPSPPVVVRVLDSSGALDTDSSDVVVEAKTASGTPVASSVATTGRAVFPTLTFSAQSAERLHFTAVAVDHASPIHRQHLETGTVVVESTVVPLYAPSFHPAGHIRFSGHRPAVAVNAQLPRIGVRLVDSAHVPAATLPAGARVTVSGLRVGVVGEPLEVAFDTDGVAWVNLTLAASPTPQAPQLCFTVSRGTVDPTVRVVAMGKRICSGILPVVVAQRALSLALATPLASPNGTDAATVVALSRFSTFPVGYSAESVMAVAVEALGAAETTVLPTAEQQTEVSIAGDLALSPSGAAAFQYVSQPDPVTSQHAAFPLFRIAQEPYVAGYFSTLWITSAMPSIATTPLAVGPIFNSIGERDSAFPVVVAEVSEDPRAFSWTRWRTHMLGVLNIEAGRVRLIRVRPGGTAETDRAYTWRGTRVDLQFLPPTTSHRNKASASKLADVFLSLRDNCVGLRLHRAYLKQNETTCDLYRLSEQAAAARRCITVSPPARRCDCYLPMFVKMGPQCAATSHLKTLCAQLSTCPTQELQDSCSEFRNQLYIEYLKIFGLAVGATAFLALVYLYLTGFFERLKRAKLGVRKEGEMTLHQPNAEPGFDDVL